MANKKNTEKNNKSKNIKEEVNSSKKNINKENKASKNEGNNLKVAKNKNAEKKKVNDEANTNKSKVDLKEGKVVSKNETRKLNKELKKERRKMASRVPMDPEVKGKIILVCIIIIIFCAFYFLTLFITKDNTKSKSSSNNSSSKSTSSNISYDEILLGRSFSMGDGEYLVIYYDESNEDISSEISSLISTYKNKESHLTIYSVNMNSPFNSKYVSDESNHNPNNASEMKINGPTLVKFNNNKVEDYIEGFEDISNYLS